MSREEDRVRFYRERDRRTIEYGIDEHQLEAPVGIAIGNRAASTPSGQVLLLAVLNMAARVHRRIHLDVPRTDLLVPALAGGGDLREAAEALAKAIDPYIDIGIGPDAPAASLGIGAVRAGIYADSCGYAAEIAATPLNMPDHPASTIGSALAACLGAASLFQMATGQRPVLRRVSLWRFQEGPDAEPGPIGLLRPVDVGDRVVIVGSGAVGSAILYWLSLVGTKGQWVVVDKDLVELHNTNRAMGLLPVHAGWSGGISDGPKAYKAKAGADLIGAEPVTEWYGDWAADMGLRPDLIIPVANQYGVREQVSQLGLPLLVHGSTSPRWTAELHRHGSQDDCITCRFPPRAFPDLSCAEGPSDPRDGQGPGWMTDRPGDGGDSALPFLSSAAGLLVVAGLCQLSSGYLEGSINLHRLLFESGIGRSWQNSHKRCRPGCHGRPSPGVRRTLNAGQRWAHIDELGHSHQ